MGDQAGSLELLSVRGGDQGVLFRGGVQQISPFWQRPHQLPPQCGVPQLCCVGVTCSAPWCGEVAPEQGGDQGLVAPPVLLLLPAERDTLQGSITSNLVCGVAAGCTARGVQQSSPSGRRVVVVFGELGGCLGEGISRVRPPSAAQLSRGRRSQPVVVWLPSVRVWCAAGRHKSAGASWVPFGGSS